MQAWHMREAIRSLGHDATLVNYQHSRHHHAEKIRLRGILPCHLKGMLLHTLKSLPFRGCVSELSIHPFTTDPQQVPWSAFDLVVVGSDVVWNYTHPNHGDNPVYFGSDPAQAATRFIAYAASCGDTPTQSNPPEYVSNGLSRFTEITVRDESTAQLVNHAIDVNPPRVVDPTWLQDDPIHTFHKIPEDAKYLLIYGEGCSSERARAIRRYCDRRKLKIVSAAFKCQTADHRLYSMDPFEWVDLFRRAECIVTSTLHGLLYAIKYNKPTLFMVREDSRSKSRLVLESCGLLNHVIEEGQVFSPDVLDQLLHPSNATEAPQSWIDESRRLFRESIKLNTPA